MTRSDSSAGVHPEKKTLVKIGKYRMLKVLGKGNFARVEEAVHTLLNVKVAVKVIDTSIIREDYVIRNLTREAKILSKLRHPSIVRLYETIQCGPLYYLVIELATGGDLYTHIKNQPFGRLEEKTARGYGRQLVAALEHMHSRGVVHRDLKMENIMLQDARKEQIKIVDFGLSNIYTADNPLKTHCGSPEYAAPELFVVGKKYGPEVDQWSLGVVFYAMATGRLPFQSPRDSQTSSEERRRKLLAQINRGLTPAQKKSISVMSSEYRNLVNRLLMPTAHKRITIQELSLHPWISNRQKNPGPKTSHTELLAVEHNAIIDEIAETTGTERSTVERDVLQSKYGEIGGMYNIKAHVIRQGGSFHAFQARSWNTATSQPYRYTAQGQNTHATNTSSRARYQSRMSALASMQMSNQPSTVQRRMIFQRSTCLGKPSSSCGTGSRGGSTGTWHPKDTKSASSSYTNQRTSNFNVHYDQSTKLPIGVHAPVNNAKWENSNSEQLHAHIIARAEKSIGGFVDRPATQPRSCDIRRCQNGVRPVHPGPEVITRGNPVEQWIAKKLKNLEKQDRSIGDGYRSSLTFRDSSKPDGSKTPNRRSSGQTISRDIRSDDPGTMGQGDRVTDRCFCRSLATQPDVRKTRLVLSNGTRIFDKNSRDQRPTTVNEVFGPSRITGQITPRVAVQRQSGKVRYSLGALKMISPKND